MANIQDLFSYRNISASIEAVKTGIPDRLPPVLNSITEQVFGNETTYHKFYGQRKLVQRTEYGAPPKKYGKQPVEQQPLILTSFKGFIEVEQELLLRLRAVDSNEADRTKAASWIERFVRDHKTRFENNRIAHKTQMLRKGAYWYDASGNLLQSSSGAVATVDFGVPAGNKGQISGIINGSWATDTTDIFSHIEQIKKKAVQATGRPLVHAFYGINIPGYIYKNASYKYYFQHNPVFYQAFSNDPFTIPAGFQGLIWHKMSDTFFENEAGSVVQGWDDDAVVFTPEITKDLYTFFEGSELVPTSMGVQNGESISTENTKLEYGMYGYSVQTVDPVLQIKLILGDNSMPVWKNGLDMYIADVTP